MRNSLASSKPRWGERERKKAEIAEKIEDVRKKRLENFARALKVGDQIKDAKLRAAYLEALESGVRPFLEEHPALRSVKIEEK